MDEEYYVVNTLDYSVAFSGTWDECNSYLNKHPEDTLAGTLTITPDEPIEEVYSDNPLPETDEEFFDESCFPF